MAQPERQQQKYAATYTPEEMELDFVALVKRIIACEEHNRLVHTFPDDDERSYYWDEDDALIDFFDYIENTELGRSSQLVAYAWNTLPPEEIAKSVVAHQMHSHIQDYRRMAEDANRVASLVRGGVDDVSHRMLCQDYIGGAKQYYRYHRDYIWPCLSYWMKEWKDHKRLPPTSINDRAEREKLNKHAVQQTATETANLLAALDELGELGDGTPRKNPFNPIVVRATAANPTGFYEFIPDDWPADWRHWIFKLKDYVTYTLPVDEMDEYLGYLVVKFRGYINKTQSKKSWNIAPIEANHLRSAIMGAMREIRQKAGNNGINDAKGKDALYQFMVYAVSSMSSEEAVGPMQLMENLDPQEANRLNKIRKNIQDQAFAHRGTTDAVLLGEIYNSIDYVVGWWIDLIAVNYDALEYASQLPSFMLTKQQRKMRAQVYKQAAAEITAQEAKKAAEREAREVAAKQAHARALSETDTLLAALDELGDLD